MKEGNVLFNDVLNTFYLRLYGVRHMVKDHSDSERGNPLLPHELLFLISSKEGKEGNILFNDTLNTFYLQLYGVRHMVKDHSDSKRGNPLLPHGLHFLISSKGYHRQDNTKHGFCYTSRGVLAGMRNSMIETIRRLIAP